ncbi:MAG TPA: hypothetical protein VK604_24375 [Bryobacteraceae bacterium]|nr:hypothetical protein [Bryobacteraceae bacterium]
MHLSKNMFGFALVASALSVSISYAEQQVKFHLPVAVQWGDTTLGPGDYRMEIPTSTLGIQSVCMHDAKKAVFALPLTTGTVEPYSSKSYLQLVNVDGTYFVRKFTSGVTGRTLTFEVPKVHQTVNVASTTDISSAN